MLTEWNTKNHTWPWDRG